jgi:hypothetical protein
MLDRISGPIKVVECVIQMRLKFHVLTLNFGLFCLSHIFFSLLVNWNLVRTMNLRVRRVVISSSIRRTVRFSIVVVGRWSDAPRCRTFGSDIR